MASRRKRQLRKRIAEGVLNAFAICLVIFPVFSIGAFAHNQFFGDPRRVSELKTIPSPIEPDLFDEGIVSVTFDDGWLSVYTDAAPILEKYDIQSTQYILPGQFESHNYISLAQAKSLKKAGHEIMSHTMTHPLLSKVSEDRAVYELEASRQALLDNNLSSGKLHFASPESDTSPFVDENIERLYWSHRNTFGDLSNGVGREDVNVYSSTFHRYDIIGFSVRTTTTLAEIQTALDYAKAQNGWLVLVYHQIDDSKLEYSVTAEDFAAQMKLIRNSNLKTATVGAVLANEKNYGLHF